MGTRGLERQNHPNLTALLPAQLCDSSCCPSIVSIAHVGKVDTAAEPKTFSNFLCKGGLRQGEAGEEAVGYHQKKKLLVRWCKGRLHYSFWCNHPGYRHSTQLVSPLSPYYLISLLLSSLTAYLWKACWGLCVAHAVQGRAVVKQRNHLIVSEILLVLYPSKQLPSDKAPGYTHGLVLRSTAV